MSASEEKTESGTAAAPGASCGAGAAGTDASQGGTAGAGGKGGMALRPDSKGKVRDIYDLGDGRLLLVATDRISAFDYILPDEIPTKGCVLTQLSRFWFEKFADLVPNHMLSCSVSDLPESFAPYADYLDGRMMIVKKASTLPVECIVRGYLTGSGKKTYDKDGTVCGIKLPEGLTEASQLPEPIFTPSTKAAIGLHDENISFEQLTEIVGEQAAGQLRELSLKIYRSAAEYALTKGIIIADTKFEFGMIDGRIALIDECITPDSSRFWPQEGYAPGQAQPSYDKQYVRNWLDAHWDRTGNPPRLPEDVIEKTAQTYQKAYAVLTGRPLECSCTRR